MSRSRKAQPSHPLTRFRDRYGSEITRGDLRAMEAQIAAGSGILIRREQDSSAVHVIRFRDVLVTAVTAPNGHIVTFLPPETVTTRGRMAYYRSNPRPKRVREHHPE